MTIKKASPYGLASYFINNYDEFMDAEAVSKPCFHCL